MNMRFSLRRSLAALTAVTLPMSAVGCFYDSEALLPLGAVCDGAGVPEAADYDPTASEQPAVAIAKEGDVLTVRRDFLSGSKAAGDIATTQIVVCVDPDTPTNAETCRYVGTGSATIKRQKQTADVKLVVAKTGQILGEDTISAEARPCPGSISFREGSEPEDQVYDADTELSTAIAEWVPGAIASAQPPAIAAGDSGESGESATTSASVNGAGPVTSIPPISIDASADAGDITAQCDALKDWTDTASRTWIGARLTAENSTLDLAEDDIKVKVAVGFGSQRLEEDLPKIQDAIKTLEDAPLAEPELLEFRNQFLTTLTMVEANLQRFQELLQTAEPLAEQSPMARGGLEQIAQQTGPLSGAITQQVETLKETQSESFGRCLKLKRN